ncbi:type II toxin-antitoxin system death-on-curing family toxin [Rhodococcus sp. NPDC058505]|uniref:type II toxin-antitoxin system death-on-curing family toxin n=1 Tax=unclassified Rhodococcus (in: high G+C Gram-positive bacteria) TaxID=192944 RepID=UPI003646A6A9
MTRYLSTEDLLAICEELGGLLVRDVGLLDAAAHRPASTVFGDDAYPDVHTKAAALVQSIVRNHALVDGNKRLCWVAAYVFYALNGLHLDAPEDSAYDLVIDASTGAVDLDTIAATLTGWTTALDG